MAMLVLPEVFERTWGMRPQQFWPKAIARVRGAHPGFLFMAEVYWDLEWTLQQQGFDYAYDKRLYDRLEHNPVESVRLHLQPPLSGGEVCPESHDPDPACSDPEHDPGELPGRPGSETLCAFGQVRRLVNVSRLPLFNTD